MSETTAYGQDVSSFDGDKNLESTHRNMAEAGLVVNKPQIVDLWSYQTIEKHNLTPDGEQYILFKKMTEADKTEFQTKTNRDIRVQSTTKDIKMNMDPGRERAELLRISITGWRLFKPNHKGELVEVGYSEQERAAFIRQADPLLIQRLEQAIRDANPWMRQEMTVEEIDVQIATLQEQRVQALELEESK